MATPTSSHEAATHMSLDIAVPASALAASHTPSAIVTYLDQYVVGQDEAKRSLAVVV